MIRFITIRVSLILLLAAIVFMFDSFPAYAESVWFTDTQLENPCLARNGNSYFAIDDIAGQLGLTVLYDDDRVLIGGSIHGTLVINPDSHIVDLNAGFIDFEEPFIRENDLWFAPEMFLDFVLGVLALHDDEGGIFTLYPEVVAITPCDGLVKITSSIPPNFRTFELVDPPRRVIDIDGVYLRGGSIDMPGLNLGMDGVATLRASQFEVQPPVVRVVLEWSSDSPPSHTLFPENRSLMVIIGSQVSMTAPCDDTNILGSVITIAAAPFDEIPVEDVTTEEPVVYSEPLEVLVDLPDDGENLPLDEIGWAISFDLNTDGELTADVTTPPFEELSDFTLAGDGMRLVIDLTGTVLQGRGERRLEGLGDVNQVRLGQFGENVTRIVFDLNRVYAYELEKFPEEGRVFIKLLSGDISGKTIVIDAGHGGEDPGAVVGGVYESSFNLEMTHYLKGFLEEQGANIILTRESDVYVPLADRIAVANEAGADLFICVHNNATEETTLMQGSLLLYSNTDYLPLYRLVHRGIAGRTGVPGIGPIPDERGLYILRHAGDMPVVFVEGAFMTNPIDFARLTDQSRGYSRNIMMGVMDGVLAYYAGRDLPPVIYPDYGELVDTGIFDLVGRTFVLSGLDKDGMPVDSGSAWDMPAELESDEDDEEEESEDDDSDDEEDDSSDSHRMRGRGAYRYD